MGNKSKKRREESIIQTFIVFIIILVIYIIVGASSNISSGSVFSNGLNILSSYENADLEDSIKSYARKKMISLNFTYMGDLDIIDELNANSKKYDAVWIANSMWLYMLDNPYLASESKSISISPVVFGVKKSKAESLGYFRECF